jgi:predicted pyridoxine 5'-phosphate oxidase superfamily flavin-nucleotide-binding protein
MKGHMMAKLTGEMKTVFERQLSVMGTASKDGILNVGHKGSKASHRIGELLYKINRFYYPPEFFAAMRWRGFLKTL